MARSPSLVSLTVLASLAVAVTGGCGEPSSSGEAVRFDVCESLTVVPAAALTDAQSAGIREAVGLWNAVARTRLTVAADYAATVPGARLQIQFEAAAAPFHGLYDEAAGRVFINTDLADRAQAIAIAHELGHAFALVHTLDHPSVMRPGNLDVAPNAADADALAAIWGVCP